MSTKFWQILDRLAGLACILVLFCLLFVQANLEVKDLDLWLHLRTGRFILENNFIPVQDIYSFTLAGKNWVNHEWLFQVISQFFYSTRGINGLINMQAVAVTVTLLVLLFMGFDPKKRNYLSVAVPLLFVLLIYRTRFTIRPDIFSLLFFSIYLYILHKHTDKKALVYAIPILQLFWTNLHGFFFLGIFLILVVLLAEFIKRKIRLPWQWNSVNRLADADFKRLQLVFILSILASLANPHTLNGFLYPFRIMLQLAGKSRIFFQYIQELRPAINFRNLFRDDGMVQYKAVVFMSFCTFILNYRKLDIGKFFIWLIFLISSLAAVRNIAFFAFVAYFVYLHNKDYIFPVKFVSFRFQTDSIKFITRLVFKVGFILWVLSTMNRVAVGGYYDFSQYNVKSVMGGVSSKDYPAGAVDFLIENNIAGNIFNDFNSGAYLIGKCFPQIKVYIDGRTEMYGPEFFEKYRKLLSDDAGPFEEIAERYTINTVILSGSYHPITNSLLKYLYKSKSWKVVYFDPYAIIFLRDIPLNQALIDEYQIDLAEWSPPELDLKKIGPTAAYPVPNINRAYLLEALNLNKALIKEAQAALKMMPNCASAYRFIGQAYKRENQVEKAFENLRLAAAYLPRDANLRIDLGIAYWKLKDIDGAIKQFGEAASINPASPVGYYYLSLMHQLKEDKKKAIEFLIKATKLKTYNTKELTFVAGSFYDNNDFELAAQAYRLAIRDDKGSANLHTRLGASLIQLNRYEEAKSELIEALNLDKKSALAYNYLALLSAKQGFNKEARRYWEKALKLSPQDKEIKENMRQFMK